MERTAAKFTPEPNWARSQAGFCPGTGCGASGRLLTPSRRVELAPPLLVADLERLEARAEEAPAERKLLLIGRRDLRSNNTRLHNSPRLVKGKQRCTLLMNPRDASALRVRDGEQVEVRSRTGRVQATLEVTDDVMAGVVSLPHGWGHSRLGTRLGVASARPGVSVNDLTDEQRLDELTGTAAFSGVPVEVGPAEA
jgi:anaerobic selenocysteine-containing dehydrogenase